MPDNFKDAAVRMRDSSKDLHDLDRYHTACYLAGYVVESYLKIFITHSLLTTPRRIRDYSHNILSLNNDLLYAASSGTTISTYRSYLIDISLSCPTIEAEWNPGKRYIDSPNEWDQVKSISFQIEMEKCFDKVIEMYINGII